ncbi:MAG: transglutaminase domain-containing protein [candidate division WOR-3 bacterium]
MSSDNIEKYKGNHIFGKAYKRMFENLFKEKNSIDRVLIDEMILLCPETEKFLYTEYTPTKSFYIKSMRPELEKHLEETIVKYPGENIIQKITGFTSELKERAVQNLEKIITGGLEEKIIKRGSDFCNEVSRVACALFQVAGFASRMIFSVNPYKAYWGHSIIEVFYNGKWGAIDPLFNVIYIFPDNKPASVLELHKDKNLVIYNSRGDLTPYTNPEQFKKCAISNYFIWEWKKYNYSESKLNDYAKKILDMANKGWPGGTRWLFKENL